MKKTRRRYDREFKISVVAELERLLGQAHAENELLKLSVGHDPEESPGGKTKTDTRRRYMIVQETHSSSLQLSISQSCHALKVSRSGYCK